MSTWLDNQLKSFVDVRPGERLLVGLLFSYFFLVMTSWYAIKAVRNSLFVARLGADNLPFAYIIAALAAGLVLSVYSRFAAGSGRRALILGTLAFLASNLLIFWWALRKEAFLTSAAFYVWAKIYSLLLISQFWLVANEFFTIPQAKRLFGLVGAGGILGGIAGSGIAGTLAEALGSENLLLLSAALLGLCAGLLHLIDRVAEPVRPRSSGGHEDRTRTHAWRLLKDNSHLRTIAFILGLTILVTTIVDWQLNKAAELFIPGEDEKTEFFGRFFVLLNVASLVIQLLFTSWVLRVFGIGVALLLLPIGLLTGSIGILIHPGLWTASFAKGIEGALRYSLDQSTRELLFLPLPSEVKYRGKPLIDLLVYRVGTGIAGLVLLCGTRLAGFGLREFALVTSVLVALWMGSTLSMKREFRHSVKRLLRVRDVEPEELVVRHLDAASRSELHAALESGDEQAILYALSLLEGIDDHAIAERADRLLHHPSDRVRSRTLGVLFGVRDRDHLKGVEELLGDPSMEVRVEAIHFVCALGELPASERMREFLASEEPEIRAAALACLAQEDRGPGGEKAVRQLGEMARSRSGPRAARERRLAAQAIGIIGGRAELHARLAELIDDPDPEVAQAALKSAATARPLALVPHLLAHLCCAGATARPALAAYGPAIYDDLIDALRNPEIPLAVRKEIPAVFYESGSQEAVNRLTGILAEMPPALRYHILKKLDRMRRNYEGLEFGGDWLERALELELRAGYQQAADRLALEDAGDSSSLLHDVLAEREAEALERVTRVLALLYPLADIVAAYQGLVSDDEASRAAGFELLDSSLSIGHRHKVSPLADSGISLQERVQLGASRIDGVAMEPLEEVRSRLVEAAEDLLLACVVRAALDRDPPDWPAEPPEPFHVHPLPRQGRSFEILLTESRSTMLKLVERADFLRDVEIFTDVATEDLAKIAAITEEREYEKDQVLFSEGDAGSEMYFIVSGRVRATRHGETAFIAERSDGVGTLTLIDARPREFTATAVQPTRVLAIHRDDFMELLRDNFGLTEGLLVHLSRVVRKLNELVSPERRDPHVQTSSLS